MELKTYQVVRTAIVKELHRETFIIKAESEEKARELSMECSILADDAVGDMESFGEFLDYIEDDYGKCIEIISIIEQND